MCMILVIYQAHLTSPIDRRGCPSTTFQRHAIDASCFSVQSLSSLPPLLFFPFLCPGDCREFCFSLFSSCLSSTVNPTHPSPSILPLRCPYGSPASRLSSVCPPTGSPPAGIPSPSRFVPSAASCGSSVSVFRKRAEAIRLLLTSFFFSALVNRTNPSPPLPGGRVERDIFDSKSKELEGILFRR